MREAREAKCAVMPIKFRCVVCQGEFDMVPGAESEAVAEFHRLYPWADIRLAGLVCEECFKELES